MIELDNQLNQKVCKSALKQHSSKKNIKRERKGLAQVIVQTTNRPTILSETAHEIILEKAIKKTGVLEHSEINCSVPITSVNSLAIQSNQITTVQTNTVTNVARSRSRGRGWRPFYRNTGETDAYDRSIAPFNIFEN